MLIKIVLKYFFGYLRITIEGYYIERFINICTTNNILIWNLKREQGVRLHLNIGIKDFYKAIEISKKLKCKTKIEKKRGIPFILNRYRKRKLFGISLVIIIALIYASSNFIWNIEINIEDNFQLENIEQDLKNSGLEIGKMKSKIDTQEIVNKIRLQRNDVSWIGIDLKGTNAIVNIVKSKSAPELIDEKEYSNIIAKKGGIITEIIAQNGTAQVKVGDRVEQGQILIRGIMEGKYTGIRNVHSLGEVKAIVYYEKTEKFPLKVEIEKQTGKYEKKYGIKFNNFQINFYKTLSKFKIYDTIEEEKKVKIFSNLYMPISLIKTTNQEIEKTLEEYTIEEVTEKGTIQIEEKIEQEIENKQNILRQKCNSNRNRRIYRNQCNI